MKKNFNPKMKLESLFDQEKINEKTSTKNVIIEEDIDVFEGDKIDNNNIEIELLKHKNQEKK